MASAEKGRSLPKFGEWDAKDPASAEGFTVIFNRARDNKKNGGTSKTMLPQKKQNINQNQNQNQNHQAFMKNHQYKSPRKKVWHCCFY